MKYRIRQITAILLALIMSFCMMSLAGCSQKSSDPADADSAAEEKAASGDIVVLFTSDVHCGVDQGWGYAGLQQIKNTLEANGNQVLLVDDGDAIQGEAIGTLSSGRAVAELMGQAGYDVAIPGNHEFDYGMENFLEIVGNSPFPYICCNLMKDGETVLEPYMIFDKGGKKIAFIGVTTPTTITSSTPKYFQEENGLYTGIEGERRVKNVMIGDTPVDPAGTYTLATDRYHVAEQGDGFTMFSEKDVVRTVMLDNEVVMKYIEETLGGVVGEQYPDPYGSGRITAAE